MTCHWIDKTSLERQSAALACKRFLGTHSFDKVAELISEIHNDYNLNVSKITNTITDNGSNMIKAFKEYGIGNVDDLCEEEDFSLNQFPSPSDQFDDIILTKHFRCCKHTIHLICSRDIPKMKYNNYSTNKLHESCFLKCHAIWNKCSKSSKASETYLEHVQKSPTFPCPTRWNSYYNCIKDILAAQDNINTYCSKST